MRRLVELDGVRGFAALIVLVHHAVLTIPAMAVPFYEPDETSPVAAWLTYSPLHALWDGTGAVYVFFVLSGFVLTLPALRGPVDWRSYYPARLARLYLPVFAAIALALILMFLVPRHDGMDSYWLDHRDVDVNAVSVGRAAVLLAGAGGLVSPLWSLQWEVWFSILLPLFVIPVLRFTRLRMPIGLAALVLTSLGGYLDVAPLRYLPMFLVGVIVATYSRELASLRDRFRGTRSTQIAYFAGAIVLLQSPWYVAPMSERIAGALTGVALLGAVGIVVLAVSAPVISRAASTKFAAWAGRISFSLYLVHEPIIITAAFLFGPGGETWSLLLSVPVSIAVAILFARFVEVPSHRLAKRIGARFVRPHVSAHAQ